MIHSLVERRPRKQLQMTVQRTGKAAATRAFGYVLKIIEQRYTPGKTGSAWHRGVGGHCWIKQTAWRKSRAEEKAPYVG